jgi:ABC-type multidrug transport system fused ATPase/permease subunit
MAFQWYTFLLLNPVWRLVNSFSELQRSLAAMERVFEVLAMDDDKPDVPGATDAPRIVHEIAFEHVEFEYREGRPVVRDFNVTVPGGSVIALVGRSGAGKTTVTDLVARFHDPTKGRILVDGTDIRQMRLRTYRDLLALVQQDVTIEGNIRPVSALTEAQQKITRALDLVGALHDAVQASHPSFGRVSRFDLARLLPTAGEMSAEPELRKEYGPLMLQMASLDVYLQTNFQPKPEAEGLRDVDHSAASEPRDEAARR